MRVDLGKIEAIMPQAEQVPGEVYSHGKRLRVYVVAVRRELRGAPGVGSRTHPGPGRKRFKHGGARIGRGADGSHSLCHTSRSAQAAQGVN